MTPTKAQIFCQFNQCQRNDRLSMEVKKQSYPQQHLLLRLVAIGAVLHLLPQTVMLPGKEDYHKEALQMLVATYQQIARKVCKRMFHQHCEIDIRLSNALLYLIY